MTRSDVSPSRVGEVLAEKYRITRFLGEGGMGTVYEAQHAVVGRRFAVKYLHAELAGEAETLERFRREARTAGALENENIVSVVDFGVASDGIPYIVMEFLVGEDLASLIHRNGPLPVVRAVNIVIQACRGLDAAHAAGIIHRDLKPENLFICRRGDGTDLVKILDFGIAKLSQAGVLGPVTSVTRSGATMGTPFYMPPEQARGAKEIDHRADIYSLGVILFEALSAERPHPGDSYNEILYHILTQPALSVASKRPELSADLVDTIHRVIAFQPQDRPGSAADLARALAPHAGRQVTPIRSQFDLRVTRPSDPSPVADARTPPGAAELKPGTPKPRTTKSTTRRVLAITIALGITGTAAWLALNPSKQLSSPASSPTDTRVAASVPAPDLPLAPVLDAQVAAAPALPLPAMPKPMVASASAKPAEPSPPASVRKKSPKKPSRSQDDVRDVRPPAPPAPLPGPSPSPSFDERNPYQ